MNGIIIFFRKFTDQFYHNQSLLSACLSGRLPNIPLMRYTNRAECLHLVRNTRYPTSCGIMITCDVISSVHSVFLSDINAEQIRGICSMIFNVVIWCITPLLYVKYRSILHRMFDFLWEKLIQSCKLSRSTVLFPCIFKTIK